MHTVKDVGYGPDFYEIPALDGNATEAEEPGFLETRLQQMEVLAPTLRKFEQLLESFTDQGPRMLAVRRADY